MAEDLDPGAGRARWCAAVGAAIFGVVMIVAFSLVTAFTDLTGLSGIGIGVGFLLTGGGRALRLLRRRRPSRCHGHRAGGRSGGICTLRTTSTRAR